MFTGLVEEMGKVVNISKKATGLGITIKEIRSLKR